MEMYGVGEARPGAVEEESPGFLMDDALEKKGLQCLARDALWYLEDCRERE
jgi:hypothetical protein